MGKSCKAKVFLLKEADQRLGAGQEDPAAFKGIFVVERYRRLRHC